MIAAFFSKFWKIVGLGLFLLFITWAHGDGEGWGHDVIDWLSSW